MTSAPNPPAPAAPPAAPGAFPAATPGPKGIDARRHRRARAHWPVRLITASGKVVSGVACDVSEGGVGVISPANMPMGTLVDLALAIPNLKDPSRSVPLRCKAKVVYCAFVGVQSRLGLQFTNLPNASRLAIHNYLVAHS